MANPVNYIVSYSFSSWQSNNPSTPLPAQRVDIELANIATSVSSLVLGVQDVRRSDGKLNNGIVTVDSLAADVYQMVATEGTAYKGSWLTGTAYTVKDLVVSSGNLYLCIVAHTSGTFATDLAAGKWVGLGAISNASGVSVTPTGNVTATDMQAAISQLDNFVTAEAAARVNGNAAVTAAVAASYETQTHAAASYETQTHAAATYETQTHAAATYAPISTVRKRLTTNTTYYVATTGSDTTGNGTSGAPWATIQKAVNYIHDTIDLAGYTVTIQVADGTYTGNVYFLQPFVGGGAVNFQGNTTTPANCLISVSSGDAITVQNAAVNIGGFKLQATTGNLLAITMGGFTRIVDKMDFGATSGGRHMLCVDSGSEIALLSNYTISGGAYAHIQLVGAGVALATSGGLTFTLTGTPNFTGAFIITELLACAGHATNSFSGAATGRRYYATTNSVITVNGAGANYFPGSIAGSTTTGGQYV